MEMSVVIAVVCLVFASLGPAPCVHLPMDMNAPSPKERLLQAWMRLFGGARLFAMDSAKASELDERIALDRSER
jgi:hypothetical protein